MRRAFPQLATITVLVGLVALIACAGERPVLEETSTQSPGDGTKDVMVNRIAFIDNNGDLLLINPDATGEERVTGDVRAGLLAQALERGDSYSWPTWSNDGSKVAFSRVSGSGPGAGMSVQVFDVESGRMIPAYTNEILAPVADGTPHYLYWSPDDRYLSLLAPTPEGLSLLVKDLHADEEAGAVAVGGPLYYHWSADSSTLAVHSGDRVTLEGPAPNAQDNRVAVDAFNFRAPAFSPDGSRLAFGGIVGGVEGIFVASIGSESSQPPSLLMETQGLNAFAWSPDGSVLAVADQTQPRTPVFNRLSLLTPDGAERLTLADEQLIAFFWSPQGDSIAWIGLDALSRSMDLAISAVDGTEATGEPRHLFRFSPTGEFFTLLSFFDQYAYSHSVWAPDGSALVVAGSDGPEGARRNGSGPHGGHVYVVDVSTGEARRIASGKVAVWSWN